LEELRERLAERRIPWSVIGDGPGIGGSGIDGGFVGGGLLVVAGVDDMPSVEVDRGVGGMTELIGAEGRCVGGEGKASSNNGTGVLFDERREEVLGFGDEGVANSETTEDEGASMSCSGVDGMSRAVFQINEVIGINV
jgi:hypothetical protein